MNASALPNSVSGANRAACSLLAVSKKHPAANIREALAAGQTLFGENYVQEMVEKAAELAGAGIEWHFIGPIQSNKTRLIAATARWVHSVDSFKVAQRLSEQKPADAPDLNICLQVNISGEASKSGVQPEELPELAAQVAALPGISLRGLMAIPAPEHDFDATAGSVCASTGIAGKSDGARFRAGYPVDGDDR